MRYIVQIFTGTYFSQPDGLTIRQVFQALHKALALIDVSDLIIGWNTYSPIQNAVLDFAHSQGIKVWLWLPVFAELPRSANPDFQIDFSGHPHQPASADEEDFTFVCPTSHRNRMIPLWIYSRHFRNLPYDGVFLDKIRHSSYAGGLARGIGCACARCCDMYASAGVDLGAVVRRIAANPAMVLPVARQGLRYLFADPDLNLYHEAKAARITEAVSFWASEFRKNGLMIGLDVFAPLLAWYVGQDLQALAEIADFIKPMLYLRTNAPAGIPFELAQMQDVMGVAPQPVLHELWHVPPEDAEGCAKEQMIELARVKCPALPGFEINRVPDVCDSDPDYVRAMARTYAEIGLTKMVLSWNLLNNTEINLAALSNL